MGHIETIKIDNNEVLKHNTSKNGPMIHFSTWKNGSYADGEIIFNEGLAGSAGDVRVVGSGVVGDGESITFPNDQYLEVVGDPALFVYDDTKEYTFLHDSTLQFNQNRAFFYASYGYGNSGNSCYASVAMVKTGPFNHTHDASTFSLSKSIRYSDIKQIFIQYKGKNDSSNQMKLWWNGGFVSPSSVLNNHTTMGEAGPSTKVRFGKRNADLNMGTWEVRELMLWDYALSETEMNRLAPAIV